jgi:hypothetical protein
MAKLGNGWKRLPPQCDCSLYDLVAGSDFRQVYWRETLTLDDPANEGVSQNEACDSGIVNAGFGFAFFELFQ